MSAGDKEQDVKDGFDLIEYPCDYDFKAMFRRQEGVNLPQQMSSIAVQELGEGNVLRCKSTLSRTAKFESITLTVRLQGREQLEKIYQKVSVLSNVVMTL
jgi:putative lipoic acid-binding regulatory protein